jgi:hypothetical protein
MDREHRPSHLEDVVLFVFKFELVLFYQYQGAELRLIILNKNALVGLLQYCVQSTHRDVVHSNQTFVTSTHCELVMLGAED